MKTHCDSSYFKVAYNITPNFQILISARKEFGLQENVPVCSTTVSSFRLACRLMCVLLSP